MSAFQAEDVGSIPTTGFNKYKQQTQKGDLSHVTIATQTQAFTTEYLCTCDGIGRRSRLKPCGKVIPYEFESHQVYAPMMEQVDISDLKSDA